MRIFRNLFILAVCVCVFTALQGKSFAKTLKLEPAESEFVSTLKLGEMEVVAIQDTPGEMDISLFKGPLSEKEKEAYMPGGKAPASVNVFVIKAGDKNILVDAGLGTRENPKSFMLERLPLAGVSADDIDMVILTHMHFDHIGGLVQDGKPVFPKAEVFAALPESEYWLAPELSDSNAELAKSVAKAYGDRFHTFNFNDELAKGVISINAVGHTPGHTVFLVESNGDALLIIGDLLHAAALQFAQPDESATYDMDMTKAAQVRRTVLKRAVDENLPVAGMHIPFPGVGYVTDNKNGGFVFAPLDVNK